MSVVAVAALATLLATPPASPPSGSAHVQVATGDPVVVLQLGTGPGARCRLTPEAHPPAAYALLALDLLRKRVPDVALRAVTVELEDARAVLVLGLRSADDDAPKVAQALVRFCAGAADPHGALATAAESLPPGDVGATAGRVGFRSVQRMDRGKATVGFAEYLIGARPDGTRVISSRSSFVVAQAHGLLRAVDVVQVEDTDAEGRLVVGRYLRVADGVLDHRLQVSGAGGKTFAYAGQVRGRAMDGTFDAPDGISTSLVRLALFRASAGGGPTSPAHLDTYAPQLEPTRPTPVLLRRDAARPHGIAMDVGGRVASGVVDDDGVIVWMADTSNPPIRFETILRQGTP